MAMAMRMGGRRIDSACALWLCVYVCTIDEDVAGSSFMMYPRVGYSETFLLDVYH